MTAEMHLRATDVRRYPSCDNAEVGLKLAAPHKDWRIRAGAGPFTPPVRAVLLARARFLEDLVTEKAGAGVSQYVSFFAPAEMLPLSREAGLRDFTTCQRLPCAPHFVDRPNGLRPTSKSERSCWSRQPGRRDAN